MKERNGFIDLLRLFFSVIILLYHYFSKQGIFISGYYAVEFFVILSGCLFFISWGKLKERSAGDALIHGYKSYIAHRYFRFFLYNLVAFIPLFFIARIWFGNVHTISGLHNALSKDIWEILMVKMAIGFNEGKGLLNNPMWTMGLMLFSEFLIMGLLIYAEKPYLTLIMPVSVFVGMGYWMNSIDNTKHTVWLGFFTAGMLRIYLLTCFGIFCCWIYKKLRQHQFTVVGCFGLTAVELLGWLWFVLVLYFVKGNRYYQFCLTIAATLLIAITLSGKSCTARWFPQTRITDFCAEWSLAIYISHRLVGRWFLGAYPGIDDIMYQKKTVVIAAALIVSLIYLFTMRWIFRIFPSFARKTRALFLDG